MSRTGAVVVIAALVIAGCARFAGQPVSLDEAALSEDGKVVRVAVIGPPLPGGRLPCSATYSANHTIDGGLLDVAVFMHDVQLGGCNMSQQICCEHEFVVELAEPFSVHGVRSHVRVSAVFLFVPPRPLVELPTIPGGWALQSQGSEWNATGRWNRFYSQHADSRPGTPSTLELGQTFGGPEGSEPEYRAQVVVNGAPANLHLWPEGEIQLDWLVGEDTIAPFGNQADFTAEELIALAESAVVPGSP